MSGIFDQIINYSPPLIVSGTVNYKGTWDASTNNPTLNNPPATSTKGDYYVVSTAGTQFTISFAVGDWIISSGTAWEKVDLTDAVSSVFGRTGAVVGVSTDYSAVGLTNTAIGASSPSTGAFTTVSASTPIAVASGGTGVSTSTGTTNVVLSNSPTIVTPVIAQINDASGNETLKLASIASAVNEISIENAATGNPVHIRATGGDASVGLHLVAKGASGYVNVTDGVDETKRLMFNASGGTTNTRTMLSSTQTVDRTLTLPDATGTLLYGGGPLGTPSSGTVTNLTGTASININGTVGATTASTGAFTTLSASGLTKIGTQTATLPADTTLWIEGGKTQRFGSSNYDADFGSYFKPSLSGSTTGQLTIGTRTSAVDTDILLISSTGLAVTGTLSTTSNVTLSSGSSLRIFNASNNDDGIWYNTGGTGVSILTARISAVDRASISSTGLAVTGALSSTGTVLGSNGVRINGAFTGNLASSVGFDFFSGSGRMFHWDSGGTGTNVFSWNATGLAVTGALSCTGALSKGSGSFRIEHPLPAKSATHQLVHSFIEGPQADLIYRGKVVLVDGKASVNIDAAATMTEGTFEVLCREVQCFTTNESGWTAVRGKVTGNILTIEAKDADCSDEISWMVIGERQDPHMMETDWTDDNGKVIVEPLKPSIESN
jgi:hypothetical protein